MVQIDPDRPLAAPTPRDRRFIEAWHAVIREFAGRQVIADPPASSPLLLEIRQGRRITCYACVRGQHEVLLLCTALLFDWSPPECCSDLACDFMRDFFPIGFVGPLSVDGPEVHSWLSDLQCVGPAPEDWGWTWRGRQAEKGLDAPAAPDAPPY